METINEESWITALVIIAIVILIIGFFWYELLKAPIIEFEDKQEEWINELNDDKWDAMKHNI